MRAIGTGWCTDMGARAWLLQSAGARPGRGVDRDLGAPICVPKLRAHHEPIARLAASLAMVCGDGHHGSALSTPASRRDGTRHRRKIRTPSGYAGMAQSAAVASAVTGVAHVMGLAGSKTGYRGAGREPPTRPTISVAMAWRDAHRMGLGGQSSWSVGVGRAVESERTGAQPAFRMAGDAVPGRHGCGFRF
jgi:hypothetical protein